jgi:hypothetical protein
MSPTAKNLFRQLDSEIESTGRLIETIRQSNRAAAHRITALIDKRTDAFVRLAEHYLPNLTHQTLATAWHEVHDRIAEILLAQNDLQKQLQADLGEINARCDRLGFELQSTSQRFEKARLDLISKTGDFQKSLREDPEITRLSANITRIDREVQQGIRALEQASIDAREKLPDYEECDLFAYLREQQYGTPAYSKTGWERRWDRWVARLINFDKANASYQYLSDAPSSLNELIREKQKQYKQLLVALQDARTHAATQHGIAEQTHLRDSLAKEVEELERTYIEAKWDRSILESDIQESEDINGEHYQRALTIYTEFLQSAKPQTLKVFAACTESMVDDEICARIRSLQAEIEAEQAESAAHAKRIIELEKYRSAVGEVAKKLRVHVRHIAQEIQLRNDFRFDIVLSDMRDLHLSPMKTWRRLLTAISDPLRGVPVHAHGSSGADVRPVDALFLAASQLSPNIASGTDCDPSGILVRPDRMDSPRPDQPMFDVLAICRSEAESNFITSLLHSYNVRCFAHNHLLDLQSFEKETNTDAWEATARKQLASIAAEHSTASTHQADCPMQAPHVDALNYSAVVVETSRFNEARRILLDELRLHDTAWDCPACRSSVDRGYHQCWRCGRTKPTIHSPS